MSKRERHQAKLLNMPPNNKPDPKQQVAFEKAMEQEHTLTFKKKELVAIFNILTNVQAKYGDFIVIAPIVEKLHPIVAVDSNIPTDEPIISGKRGIA